MWFYLVLFLLGIVSRYSPAVVAPRFFDHAFFAKKIGAFQCALFIRGFEDEAIAEVKREHACFLAAERRDE